MTETLPEDDLDPVLIEAADWFVRLTSGQVSDADAAELADWRSRSAEHEAAFRELALQRLEAKALDRSVKTARRRDVLLGMSALVATGAGYGMARPPFGLWPSFAELTADHRTGAGQRYAFAPAPGVKVEMNARSSLSLTDRGAGVALIRGEAFVAVNERRAPFHVTTQAVQIQTSGARFNLRALAKEVDIACAQGALSCIDANGMPALLRGGEALTIGAGGQAVRSRIDPDAVAPWMQGLLIFNGAPLSQVIEQINLYRPGKIILTDHSLGETPVQGVFHTAQIENAVGQLAQLPGVNLRRLPGGVVLIS